MSAPSRPPFIISTADVPETTHRYPNSDEPMAPKRAIARAAGLLNVGLHIQRVPPVTAPPGRTPSRRTRSSSGDAPHRR